ncbi:unnamed protein product [Penicillium crustosum]
MAPWNTSSRDGCSAGSIKPLPSDVCGHVTWQWHQGFGIGFFNTVFNSTNILFSIWSMTSQSPGSDTWLGVLSSPSVAIGAAAYTVGILTELVSELQRERFKKNPANKGKPYGGGLFSLAININYGAYTLWRGGFALASGGWTWGLFTFSFFFYDFVTRGVPVLDQYCTKRVSISLCCSSEV